MRLTIKKNSILPFRKRFLFANEKPEADPTFVCKKVEGTEGSEIDKELGFEINEAATAIFFSQIKFPGKISIKSTHFVSFLNGKFRPRRKQSQANQKQKTTKADLKKS